MAPAATAFRCLLLPLTLLAFANRAFADCRTADGYCQCGPTGQTFIGLEKFCDGVDDCGDGADETQTLCDIATFSCTAYGRYTCNPVAGATRSVCLAYDNVCDGQTNCPSGSDEADATCPLGLNCADGRGLKTAACPAQPGDTKTTCVAPTGFCDGQANCPGGTDESATACPADYDCTMGGAYPYSFSCRTSPTRCLPWGKQCDGVADCSGTTPYDESPAMCPLSLDCSTLGKFTCAPLANASSAFCIDYSKQCDGTPDCPSGSDEDPRTCADRACAQSSSQTKVACPSLTPGQCIEPALLCDGVPNNNNDTCADGSDESRSFCQSFNCTALGKVQCPGLGQCIAESQMCDGTRHCNDGSDERAATCLAYTGQGKCNITQRVPCPGKRQCIFEGALCDGNIDCKDVSDETRTFCREYAKRNCTLTGRRSCPSGVGCLDANSVCDGTKDCRDESDEKPSFCRGFKCSSIGLSKCPGGTQCMDARRRCDGVRDCRDGSDESTAYCKTFNCSRIGKVRCPRAGSSRYQCSFLTNFCNGKQDCPSSADEAPRFNCTGFSCQTGFIKCRRNNTCMPGFLCNGYVDDCDKVDTGGFDMFGNAVYSGYDEDPAFCASYQCPEGWVKCREGTTCIPERLMCNDAWNRPDCPDMSDEDPETCATYDCTRTGRIPCPGGGGGCLESSCSICRGGGAAAVCPGFPPPDTSCQYCSQRGADCPAAPAFC